MATTTQFKKKSEPSNSNKKLREHLDCLKAVPLILLVPDNVFAVLLLSYADSMDIAATIAIMESDLEHCSVTRAGFLSHSVWSERTRGGHVFQTCKRII